MTDHPRISVTLIEKELRSLRREARDHESDSNLVRRKLGFPPLAHGGNRKSPKHKTLSARKK